MAEEDWVRGPEWLYLDESQWPISSLPLENRTSLEQKTVFSANSDNCNQINPLYLLISRRSLWMKLLRVAIYVLRFVKSLPRNKLITSDDLQKPEIILIKFYKIFILQMIFRCLNKQLI